LAAAATRPRSLKIVPVPHPSALLGLAPLPEGGVAVVYTEGRRGRPMVWSGAERGDRFVDCLEVLALDAASAARWMVESDGMGCDLPGAVAACAGGVVVTGVVPGVGDRPELWLAKVADDGAAPWSETYGQLDGYESRVAALSDGFAMVGQGLNTQRVVRTDAAGRVVWQREDELVTLALAAGALGRLWLASTSRGVLLGGGLTVELVERDGTSVSKLRVPAASLQATLLAVPREGGGVLFAVPSGMAAPAELIAITAEGKLGWRSPIPAGERLKLCGLAELADGRIVCGSDHGWLVLEPPRQVGRATITHRGTTPAHARHLVVSAGDVVVAGHHPHGERKDFWILRDTIDGAGCRPW